MSIQFQGDIIGEIIITRPIYVEANLCRGQFNFEAKLNLRQKVTEANLLRGQFMSNLLPGQFILKANLLQYLNL